MLIVTPRGQRGDRLGSRRLPGGFKNRELNIWTVGLASQLAALMICAPVLLAAGGAVPEHRVLVYGVLAASPTPAG